MVINEWGRCSLEKQGFVGIYYPGTYRTDRAILVHGKGLREIRRPILSSSFDEYLFLFGKFLFVLLRKGEVQYTVPEACLDVLLGDVLAYIEASLH